MIPFTIPKKLIGAALLASAFSATAIAQSVPTLSAHYFSDGVTPVLQGTHTAGDVDTSPPSGGYDRVAIEMPYVQSHEWVILIARAVFQENLAWDSNSPEKATYDAIVAAHPWIAQQPESPVSDTITASGLASSSLVEDTSTNVPCAVTSGLAGLYCALSLNDAQIYGGMAAFGVNLTQQTGTVLNWPAVTYPWEATGLRVNNIGFMNALWSPTYGGIAPGLLGNPHMLEVSRVIESAIVMQAGIPNAVAFLGSNDYGNFLRLGGCVDLQGMIVSNSTGIPPLQPPLNFPGEKKIRFTRKIRICMPSTRVETAVVAGEINTSLITTPYAMGVDPYTGLWLVPYNISSPTTASITFKFVSGSTGTLNVSRAVPYEALLRVPFPANFDPSQPVSISPASAPQGTQFNVSFDDIPLVL